MTDDYDNVFFQNLEKIRDQVNKCAFSVLEYVEDDALKGKCLSELEKSLISCVEAEREVALSKKAAKEAVKRAVDEESELPDTDKYDEAYQESLEELEQERHIQEVIDNAPSVKAFREQLLAQCGGTSNADDNEELVITENTMNIIDPISKKIMTDPVRNKHCGHVYDRSSVVDMIKVNKRKGFKCPSIGCGYRERLKLNDLEDALDVKRKIILHLKKYGRVCVTHETKPCGSVLCWSPAASATMDGSRVKSVILPLGGALLLCGVARALYYFLTKKDEDEIKLASTSVNQWASAKVQVPVDSVGLVIGRQGSNIRLIQERTNTKINFSDEEVEGHRTCIIRGSEDNITLAQKLIIKAVNEQPVIETSEMFVPTVAVGRVIGRNGESVRSISRVSGAKIIVEREEDRALSASYPEDMRRIILKGSKEQIEAARSLLLEKVVEEEEMRQQINASAANMSMRARGRQGALENSISQSVSMSTNSLHQEALSSTSSDRFIEAYVSAVDSASHFWLQVVGPRSVQLDKLVTEMTEYYDSEENRELHELDKVNIDSIVAAKFPHDNSWYRGKVCSYEHNETDPSQSHVTVYYVDFGDTETIKMDCVCELRTDFLKLNFQAIECFLANIEPKSVKGDEAADVFEELTYAAQWKVVMVKVVGYQQAEEKTIPCVLIIDTNGPSDIDVAEELVKRGLAEFSNAVSSLASSSSMS